LILIILINCCVIVHLIKFDEGNFARDNISQPQTKKKQNTWHV
jgi:hypothetical protein